MSNFVEIRPRELKPALLELDGISRTTVEAHYRLYQGYVGKRNEILGRLASVDLGAANQVFSEIRSLKVDLTFAVGGIKNHELYFEHLGGEGGDPDGPIGGLIERDFGSADAWRADLRATGMAGWSGANRPRSTIAVPDHAASSFASCGQCERSARNRSADSTPGTTGTPREMSCA